MKNMFEKVCNRKYNRVESNNIIQIEELAKNKVSKKRSSPLQGDQKKDENLSNHLVTLWEPYSMTSEQYRELRTHILEASKKDGKRVFLISSAISGEGKTLVAINLAISLASGFHDTVLLIDADLRNPNVSRMLGLKKDTEGLAEYLAQGANLADFITKTSIFKLNVITSGMPPENPSELISSRYMSDLVKEVKNRYDNRFIIIDAPPLLPVSDAIVLSSLVDGVIIVVKALSTQREMVSNAIEKIEKKEKILGLVINCCKGTTNYPYYGYEAGHQIRKQNKSESSSSISISIYYSISIS